jgi:endoglucanase
LVQVSSGNGANLLNLKDPAGGDKLIYEMHQYLDRDGSGTSETCVSSTIGEERIREATAWLKANKKKGILGETAGGANAQCIAAVTGMLSYMVANSDVWTGWLWWGGGPWWGNYMYSIEPPGGVAYQRVLPSLQPYI